MNDEYWEEQFLLLNKLLLQKGEEYIKDAAKDYVVAILAIEKEINAFYLRFAKDNHVPLQQAKRI